MNIEATRRLLAGLAAGDCLGSTSEFQSSSTVLKTYDAHKAAGWPFSQVGCGAFGWRKGQGTDDTDLAWAIVKAAVESGGTFNPERTGQEFLAWKDTNPRDIGGTTSTTLAALRKKNWYNSGYAAWMMDHFNAANGSLMRNGVIPGLVAGEEIDALFRATVHHSIITHYHPLPVLCCAMQSWIIAGELSGWGDGPLHADQDEWFDAFFSDWSEYIAEEEDGYVGMWIDRTRDQWQEAGDLLHAADFDPDSFNPYQEQYAGRSGYCLLTLQIGVWALHWANRTTRVGDAEEGVLNIPHGMPMRDAMMQRVNVGDGFHPLDVLGWVALIGHDSDTYGATAGPMLAAAFDNVPAHLTDGLEVLPKYDAMIAANKIVDASRGT